MKRATSERWPPVFAMGCVAVLVALVLPNPLRIPQNNPAAQPDYAPVPGKNDETSNDANFGETDTASSDGIGSEGGPGGEPEPVADRKIESVFSPRHKNCVGGRQTEDPLSPVCVPFFEGDNGGETWAGVTRTEILVIYYNDFGIEGDLTEPWRPSDENSTGTPAYYYQNHARTVKSLLRYFELRFQTYARRVRLIGFSSGSGLGTSTSQRISEMQQMAALDPFAIVTLIENAQGIAPKAREHGIPVFGWNEDVPLEVYEQNRPYLWSFMPDQHTETVWSAAFLCRKLRGRPARFTTDPVLLGRPRKFGLIFQQARYSQRGPFLSQLAAQLQDEVSRQCQMRFDYVKGFQEGTSEASGMFTSMKIANVTTLVCYCIAQQTELHIPKFQTVASGIDYYPEWYWDSTAAMDRALWQQQYGNPSHQGFGSSYLWRQGPFDSSYAYQAYTSQAKGSIPNPRFNFEMYHTFLSLFSGIQAAGPVLTPESVERGMFTFKWTRRDDPFIPTGGYGASSGPSPYTFVHSAMAWWYDPTGTPPGRNEPDGCLRVAHRGLRFFGPDWPLGDDDLFVSGMPCTEDTRRDLY